MITLATLEKATHQEIYDQVRAHLLEQNEQCANNVTCLYRHQNPFGKILKCAAGCLISDEEMNDIIKKGGNSSLSQSWNSLVGDYNLSDNGLSLIEDLQQVHDNSSVEFWPSDLEEVAVRHGLLPCPEEK